MFKSIFYLFFLFITFMFAAIQLKAKPKDKIVIEITSEEVSDILPITLPVTVPETLTALTKQFKTVGTAKFSVLFWDIYQSRLLTTSGRYPISGKNEQLVYEINYFADISSDDLVKRTQEQWQHIGVPSKQYQVFLPQLKKIWPDINTGDSLSLLINPQQSYFYFNQQYVGMITTPEFGQLFLDIWLSEETSQPELRLQLLGKNDDK